jgi:phosphate-selective porin OprO/OprP
MNTPLPEFRTHAHSSAILCALLLSSLGAARAFAKDDLLEVLAQKGVITMEEYEKLKAQQRATGPTFSTDGGFKFTSGDGAMSVQIGTLQQVDVATYDDDTEGVDFGNGMELRRSRIYLQGNLGANWQYKVEYDFSTGATAFTDLYAAYSGWKPVTLTIGNFKQPFSMEAMTSARYGTTFMERGLPFAFGTLRAAGVSLGSSGTNWYLSGGYFGEPIGNVSAGGDEGRGIAARGTWAPFFANEHVLHLGLGITSREPTEDNVTTSTGQKITSVRFRSKPESNILSQRLVDTGDIPDVDRYDVAALELAGQVNAFSAQGEYFATQVSRDIGGDLDFSGWYFQLACTLTGEARPYRADRGYFETIEPGTSVGDGGWGAWEIAVRMSELDLTDGDINGGKERDATLGVNWYMNRWLKLMGNVVKVLDVDGGPFDGVEPFIYQMRFQIAI